MIRTDRYWPNPRRQNPTFSSLVPGARADSRLAVIDAPWDGSSIAEVETAGADAVEQGLRELGANVLLSARTGSGGPRPSCGSPDDP